MHVDHDQEAIEEELLAEFGPDYPTRLTWRSDDFARQLKASGRTQDQLSSLTGIKQPTISELKTGRVQQKEVRDKSDQEQSRPTREITLLYALADAMGCDLRDFADIPPGCGRTITTRQIRKLQSRLLDVERIHTLMRPGEKIRLRDLYYRTMLLERSPLWHPADDRSAQDAPAILVDSLNDLPHAACAILGTAGQGKSIFLRYLVVEEALAPSVLPLFYELRLWGPEPVRDQLLDKLRNLGLCRDEADLESILKKGRIALLFDAFDELDVAHRQPFLRELGQLRDAYPHVRIIVTSRPDSGILSCNWLQPYSIAPLKRTDVESLIRIYAGADEAEAIIPQVKSAANDVIALLASPIFVALVVIKFQHSRTIPKNLVEFYRDLFDALVRRQNQDESGLKRTIESKLLPYQLEKAFQELSFVIHHDFGDQPPHLRQVEDIAVLVAEGFVKPVEAPPLIVSDIIRVTNLLLEEAGSCFYLHKSVREYYAAAFIAGQPPAEAQQTYARIAKRWPHWRHVLSFLAELDAQRMAVFFERPELEALLQGGRLSYLKQFDSFLIVKTDNGQEQLHIGGGTAYCARDHRIVCGSLRKDYVRNGFQTWCSGFAYPSLEPGGSTKIPKDRIDFPRLLEWLGDNLTNAYASCEQRLSYGRRLAERLTP